MLEDNNTGELFAQAPLNNENPEVSVEPVTDSSRYFAIRVDDGRGHHAILGLGFRERSDAFDFNVALQDHVKQVTSGAQGDGGVAATSAPALDLSLKQGETLKINIGGLGRGGGGASKREAAMGASSGLGALPPPPALSAPPGSGAGGRRRVAGGAAASSTDHGTADLLGGGSTGGFGDDSVGSGGGFRAGAKDEAGWTTFG